MRFLALTLGWVLTAMVGQPLVASSAGDVSSVEGTPTSVDRIAMLQQALADFEAAVAMKNDGSLEAQRFYRKALDGFNELVADGAQSAELHYNIANTHLRLGEIGKAVVEYRRALRLSPGDERIRKNLDAARKMCEVKIDRKATSAFVEAFFFWHFKTALASRLTVALFGYMLFWGLMFCRLFVLRRSVAFAWTIRLVLILVVIVGASVAWDLVTVAHRIEGVTIADGVILRKGNGSYYEPLLDRPLSQGVEVRVKSVREDVDGALWYQVELRDGKEGWLEGDQVGVI